MLSCGIVQKIFTQSKGHLTEYPRRPVDIHVSHQSRICTFNFRYSLKDAISENLPKVLSVSKSYYTLNQPDYINTLIAFDSICAVTSNLHANLLIRKYKYIKGT